MIGSVSRHLAQRRCRLHQRDEHGLGTCADAYSARASGHHRPSSRSPAGLCGFQPSGACAAEPVDECIEILCGRHPGASSRVPAGRGDCHHDQRPGGGITPQDLPKLFERFYRAGKDREAEGIGLRLYITKLLLEAHGGRIWVGDAASAMSADSWRVTSMARRCVPMRTHLPYTKAVSCAVGAHHRLRILVAEIVRARRVFDDGGEAHAGCV